MTLTRKLAQAIAKVVVRYASPGCQPWAEGLATEIDHIPSDWTALRWSLGSTRVLLDRREAPLTSLDEVPALAARFAKARDNATSSIWWIFFLLQAVSYSLKFLTAHSQQQRIGTAMVACSTLYLGLYSIRQRRRLERLPPLDPDLPSYQAELLRLRDLYRSPEHWVGILATITYVLGLIIIPARGSVSQLLSAVLMLTAVSVLPLALRARRLNQRRLQRLHELLEQTHHPTWD